MKTIAIYSFLLLTFVSTYTNQCFSQEKQSFFELKGKLNGEQQSKVDDVTIYLLNATDKKLVKIEYVDSQGGFIFQRIPAGNYTLATQSMTFAKYQSETIALSKNTDMGTINLKPMSNTLKEVSVTAVKPFIQQRYDKTVLNVASSISAVGSTALEVLEKAPGITIDQNDNIAMRGRQGVLVMVDGKLVPMSGQDLANLLRNMSANQIEKIDLITNPSAKYDASGNSGIIDIRLKKGTSTGTNGNVSMSYGQGKYPKLNPALNFNTKNKNLNIFGSYNYAFRQDIVDLIIFRSFYDNNDRITGGNNYNNVFKMKFNNHNARIGADYNISPQAVIGFAANGIFSSSNVNSNSMARSLDAQQQTSGFFNTGGDSHRARQNKSINLNYKHTLDTSGKELSADLDYAKFTSNELQNYTTDYLDANQVPNKAPYLLFGDLNGNLSIRSFKIDYTNPLKSIGASIDGGLKSSWVRSDNDVSFYDRSNGGNVLDVGKSNRFIYKENINAAYLNASKNWKQLSLQLGLRMENTNVNGVQVTNNESFDRHYTQFFPSGYIGYKFGKVNDLGLSLSRRIERPSYRDLNPFKVFLDPLTSSQGNPSLKPEITSSFELTHTLLEKYVTKIGYSQTTDNIITVLSPDTDPHSVIQTGRNLAKYDYYSASFGFPISIGKWFNSNNTALVYYGKYSGNLVNTDLKVGRAVFNFNSSNSIIIDAKTSLEVVGSYQSRSYYGFLDVASFWFVNVGAQRQLWNKRASLKLNISDVFYTNQTRAVTKLTGYGEDFWQKRDTRIGTISFNYKFGGPSNGSRRKTGGAEEEKQRAG